MLKIFEISTLNEFLELKQKWNEVLAKSKDNNIFLTWEYLSTFWRYFGRRAKLRILCVKDEDEIVAIAPLRQSHFGIVGSFGYDVIEPLGYRGLMPEGGDYTGLLLGEKEEECFKLFLNYLTKQNDWDFIYLYDVPETSSVLSLLGKIIMSTPKFEIKRGAMCPYITLPASMDMFLEGLDGKFRKNLRRCMKNLQKDYGKIELNSHNDFGSVEDAMEIFFKLHQKRWKFRQMPGVLSTQIIRDFYINVAKSFDINGWLALYFLTANDEPVAAHYCFEYGGKLYFALSGFNLNYSRYSIGNLLTLKVIEQCIMKKLKEFDFMKGDEPYKSKWTREYKRNLSIRFINGKLTSRLYNWGIKAVKQAKIDETLEKLPFLSQKGNKQ
ncbi:MAG: GNAT family N-acetyltransferase [Candidatus Bathyarchaeia archaeon]